MLYLRRGAAPERYDIWSTTRAAPVASGLTELEVRRAFRERAIAAARKAVTELLADVQARMD